MDVRLPATVKRGADHHAGRVEGLEPDGLTVVSRVVPDVGDTLDLRVELVGAGVLIYLEVVVRSMEEIPRGEARFRARITRMPVADRSALYDWLRARASSDASREEVQRIGQALGVAGTAPAGAEAPRRVPPPHGEPRPLRVDVDDSPGAPDPSVVADWATGLITVRWRTTGALARDWRGGLKAGGLLIDGPVSLLPRGTRVTMLLLLPGAALVDADAEVIGEFQGRVALNLALTPVDRDRLRVYAGE